MIALALALSLAAAAPPSASRTYSGAEQQTHVTVPRLDAPAVVDGVLDEPVWAEAAVLTGFSQYAPVDGRPADDQTEVLVWYSPDAIYFGIRARAASGTVHASLADRDRIDADDYVQIFLSPFNDGRQAFMFGVNPLGIQQDGSLAEGLTQARGSTSSIFSGLQSARDPPDLSPDFVFESKGRVTETGFDVEVRIPFKSLRYQAVDNQSWGLHVIRRTQSTGHEDSWVAATRSGTSFLAQAGSLDGLTGLHRGLVMDLNPVATAKIDGARSSAGAWAYATASPELGGNIRWGVTPNLTMNGTVNPDFSQVETDEGQFSADPRAAVYFAEKRPFFLEGLEQFATPNQLIYTRRIVAPVIAGKLAGKTGGTSVAVLSAIDDPLTSESGHDSPLVNVVRVQRDLWGPSRVAFVYTGRTAGATYNHVVAGDARLTFGALYTLQLQAGISTTRGSGTTRTAPIWEGIFSRNGRRLGLKYTFRGISQDFVAANGFISRPGMVDASLDHQVTFYGRPGALIESFSTDLVGQFRWQYWRFSAGAEPLEKKLHSNNNMTLRGGWKAGASVLVEDYGFDDRYYASYGIEQPVIGTIVPFTTMPRIPNLDWALSLNTPQFPQFTGSLFYLWGKDENFYEWSPANIVMITAKADWRPTPKLRVGASYQRQSYQRRSDLTTVGVQQVPRLKIEYQLSRYTFVRMVGQYTSEYQDDLRDDSRTDLPLAIRDRLTGQYRRALASEPRHFRLDWLFSYQPTPGTVVFAGYGNSLDTPGAIRFGRLQRTADGFFTKISYLFRL